MSSGVSLENISAMVPGAALVAMVDHNPAFMGDRSRGWQDVWPCIPQTG